MLPIPLDQHCPPKTLRLETVGLGILIACVTSSLIYRTYSISMPYLWLEMTRQFEVVFLALEIGIICYARLQNVDIKRHIAALDWSSKIALTLFLITFWVGALFFSPNPALAVIRTFIWLIHILFLLSLYHCLRPVSETGLNRFAAILVVAVALIVPIIAVHLAFPPDGITSPNERFGWGIAIPGFISGRLFGSFCGCLLAFLIGLVLRNTQEHASPGWSYAAIFLVAALVIWSGTRAAVAGVGCAVIIGILTTRTRIQVQTLLKLALCFLLAGLIAVQLIPYDDPYFYLFEAKDFASGNAASGGRFSLWLSTARIIADHPIFGAGDGMLPALIPPNVFPHVQPHNAILQFMLAWGIAGAIPAIFLLGKATWHTHIIARSHPYLLPILAMLDALLVMSMLDGMLYFSQFLLLALTCYAAIFAANRPAPSDLSPAQQDPTPPAQPAP